MKNVMLQNSSTKSKCLLVAGYQSFRTVYQSHHQMSAVQEECQATGESVATYGMLWAVIGSYRGTGADQVAGALSCYQNMEDKK
jgi:hypothetical protein